MKNLIKYFSILMLIVVSVACDDESDMAIHRVASPVVIEVSDSATDEVTVLVSELDKSGIMDNSVGIVSTPVSDLIMEVFAGGASLGQFTTDDSGKIIVTYVGMKPNEYAGTYKGVAFRIKK
jgi:hypothetical protein